MCLFQFLQHILKFFIQQNTNQNYHLNSCIGCLYIYIYIYIYIPWIIRDKSHLDIGIVNMDINATRQRRYNISTNKIFIHFLYFPSILYTRYGKRHVHNTNSYRNIYLKKIKNKQNIYSSIRYCGKYITNMCY